MGLIQCTGTTEPITAITAAHQPGELFPTFSLTIRPQRGNERPVATHTGWNAPEELTFTIGGASWVCYPSTSPRRLSGDGGVTYDVTYIPAPAWMLRYARYGKNLTFLSCPSWQYLILKDTINEDTDLLYHKESDVYPSDGWTVNAVLQKIGELFEITITSRLPDLHVAVPSLTMSREEVVLSFIQSLLPSGFYYAWDWQANALTLALAEPVQIATSLLPPVGATSAEYDVPSVIEYDSVIISGGPYKINSGITMGLSAWKNMESSSQGQNRANQTITETLPDETQTVGSGTQTIQTTRTTKMGPDGNPFMVLSETRSIVGSRYNAYGTLIGTATLQEDTTEYQYENHDAMIYLVPRLVASRTVASGYVTVVAAGQTAVSVGPSGILYWLTQDLQVLTAQQWLDQPAEDRATVIASAYSDWVDEYETVEESKAYVQTTQVTPDWQEGYETLNVRTVTRLVYSTVANTAMDCLTAGNTALQIVAASLQTEGSPSVAAVGVSSRVVEQAIRKIKLQSPKSYIFEDTSITFDYDQARMITNTARTPINSAPPASPTQYRVEPLKLTAGKAGEEIVYSTTGQIPTCNPHDFETWAGKLFRDIISPHRTMTVTVRNYVLPAGYRFPGGTGTVVGWTASQQGAESSATMTAV